MCHKNSTNMSASRFLGSLTKVYKSSTSRLFEQKMVDATVWVIFISRLADYFNYVVDFSTSLVTVLYVLRVPHYYKYSYHGRRLDE